MDPAPHTDQPRPAPTRPISLLNASAVIVCVLSVMGALGIAALSVTAVAAALGAVLSWMILLVIALSELFWAAGALLGLLLAGLGLSRRARSIGAIIPAIVCLLLLIGYVVYAAAGKSLFFG